VLEGGGKEDRILPTFQGLGWKGKGQTLSNLFGPYWVGQISILDFRLTHCRGQHDIF
jgi:hypothetical protein